MPVYLITLHAYRSWMPDHSRGYVARGKGILPADEQMANLYRTAAVESPCEFNEERQQFLIDKTLEACSRQTLRCHFIATDPTHLHLLLSWKSEKTSKAVRKAMKTSLTRRLNQECERRTWFSRSGSRKRVRDDVHFNHLVQKYLPSHQGWKWCEIQGYFL